MRGVASRALPVALGLVLLGQHPVLAATVNVNIVDSLSTAFKPQTVAAYPGDTVHWTNAGTTNHTTTGDAPLSLWDSGTLVPAQTFDFTFTAGGTYPYHDAMNPSVTGKVKIRITASPTSGPRGTKFTITISSVTATAPFVYDVQVHSPLPGSSWQAWKRGITAPTVIFDSGTLPAGTYKFRSKIRNTSTGAKSNWSPALLITVTS